MAADAVGNLEVPPLTFGADKGNLDARAVALTVDVPEKADGTSLRLLLAATVEGIEVLAWGAQIRWAAEARAGRVVPIPIFRAFLWSAGTSTDGYIPELSINAFPRVGVADAAALFNTPFSMVIYSLGSQIV